MRMGSDCRRWNVPGKRHGYGSVIRVRKDCHSHMPMVPFHGSEEDSSRGDGYFLVPRIRGLVAQLVRAPHCHCGGRGSESRRSRQDSKSDRVNRSDFCLTNRSESGLTGFEKRRRMEGKQLNSPFL